MVERSDVEVAGQAVTLELLLELVTDENVYDEVGSGDAFGQEVW
jgi:hypothetical protein